MWITICGGCFLAAIIVFGVTWYFSIRDLWKEWPGLHDLDTK